jgi:hypothetical protein
MPAARLDRPAWWQSFRQARRVRACAVFEGVAVALERGDFGVVDETKG